MREYTTVVSQEIDKKSRITELPPTPFFVEDGGNIYMVIMEEDDSYSYVFMEDGSHTGSTSTEEELLNSINHGVDNLLKSKLILTE